MIHSSGFGFFLNRMHFNSSVRFLRSGEPLSRGQIIWRALSIHRGRGFRTSHPHSSRSSRSFILVHQLHPFIGVHSSPFIRFIRSSVFIHPRSSASSVYHVHSSPFISFIRSSRSFILVHQLYPFITFIHPRSSCSSDSSVFIHPSFIRLIRSSVFIHPRSSASSVHHVHSSSFIMFIRSSVFIHPRSSASSVHQIHPHSSASSHSSRSSVHRCSFIRIHQVHPHSSDSSQFISFIRSSRSSAFICFIRSSDSSPFISFIRSSVFIHPHSSDSSPFIRFIRSSVFIHPSFISFIRSSVFIHHAHQIHPHSSDIPIHQAHPHSSPFIPFITLISIHPHSSSFITFVHPRSSAFIGVHNLRIISDIAQKFLCSFPRVYLDLQCPKAKNRALTT